MNDCIFGVTIPADKGDCLSKNTIIYTEKLEFRVSEQPSLSRHCAGHGIKF